MDGHISLLYSTGTSTVLVWPRAPDAQSSGQYGRHIKITCPLCQLLLDWIVLQYEYSTVL